MTFAAEHAGNLQQREHRGITMMPEGCHIVPKALKMAVGEIISTAIRRMEGDNAPETENRYLTLTSMRIQSGGTTAGFADLGGACAGLDCRRNCYGMSCQNGCSATDRKVPRTTGSSQNANLPADVDRSLVPLVKHAEPPKCDDERGATFCSNFGLNYQQGGNSIRQWQRKPKPS